MSGALMEWIVEMKPKLSHATARVLFVLAKHANFDGTSCFPSLQTMADQAEMPKSTVTRALSELRERKYVRLLQGGKGGGRSNKNHYLLTLGQPTAVADPNTPDLFPETVAPRNPLSPRAKGSARATKDVDPAQKGSMASTKGSVVLPDSIKTQPLTTSLSPSGSSPPLRVVAGTAVGEAEAAVPVVKQDAKGTRLPPDWQPSQELREFAIGLGLDPAHIAANFRDYWHSKPGQGGRKAQWDATWRIWCRKEAERTQQHARPVHGKLSQAEKQAAMMANLRRGAPGNYDGQTIDADPMPIFPLAIGGTR